MAEISSTKPYLLRAIYEWCVDNGFTPYVSVAVDADTRVPMEYVRDGEIVLNIGPLASQHLQIGAEWLECAARFGGVAREISVPIAAIKEIYSRENGQGMAFPAHERKSVTEKDALAAPTVEHPPDSPKPGGRPTLKRVK
jgi:stringent starvation protein B